MTDTHQIWTLDQLLRQRAIDEDQTPLLAFPKTRRGVADYEKITGASLHRFVDGAAKCLLQRGFPAVDEEIIVGICAPTDLDYIVTIFALIRLGYTVFQLSSRLAPSAILELLALLQCGRQVLLYAPDHASLQLGALSDLELHPIVTRSQYDNLQHQETPDIQPSSVDYSRQNSRRCLVLHSSGSTGIPKSIDYSHQKLMATGIYAQDSTSFITMPFSHALGMNSFMQAIHKRKTIYALSGYVPQTHENVSTAIKAANPEIIWTVPYVLKLLAEKPSGIDAIRNCRFVSSGGSKLPDELGDLLTNSGVHIGMQFGSTETGLILSSAYRPRSDKAWNYLRPLPHVLPYVKFQLVDGDKHECIVLDGHKGKIVSNSDDPPNSWRTSDLFVPHPVIPHAWKFVGRMDDRIMLLNGEKVLPLNIEGRIRSHPLVREAVVFGTDREVPGLLLFKAAGTSHMENQKFLDQVWPIIEYANSRTDAFSQISKEMVAVIPEDVECPLTDKSSIQRGLVYKEFSSVIDATYAAVEKKDKGNLLTLTVQELEHWILENFRYQGCELYDNATDFFSAGMDSLQAIRLRGLILRNIDLGGNDSECSPLIVYDCGNAHRLARKLYVIRTGDDIEDEQSLAIRTMKRLVDKYSNFTQSESCIELPPAKATSNQYVIIITGATGFLGAHILSALIEINSVSKVYGLVRRSKGRDQSPMSRLQSSLQSKGFDLSLTKVVPLYHDITQDNFGLDTPALYNTMKSEVTHIIHCAWSVNFAIPLVAFEPQLLGLHNLLALAQQTHCNARLLFCSSIGVAQSTKGLTSIPSEPIPSLESCGQMGYAQSKLIGERIVESSVRAGANATILRIGQIIPGRRRGTKLWNPTEAVPLMVRSSRKSSTGALPILSAGRDSCDWIEADTLADTILHLAGIGNATGSDSQDRRLVYNIVNPRPFSWKHDFIPALHRVGLDFDTVSWDEWLDRLDSSAIDTKVNPSRKLLGFWRNQIQREKGLVFDTAAAEIVSSTLRSTSRAVDGDLIKEIVEAWKQHENAVEV